MLVFDFPVYGKREGEYISLGYHEKEDVRVVIDFVKTMGGVHEIGLWSRSMGFGTNLLYSYCDEKVLNELILLSLILENYQFNYVKKK